MAGKAYKIWAIAALLVAPQVRLLGEAFGANEKHLPSPSLRHWATFGRESKFVPVPRSPMTATCEFNVPPQPLTTPTPLIDVPAADKQVSISFIIGTDGLVHSPLLLRSVGGKDDRAFLGVVRSWRYRPGLCNGVPTETEATVDFSIRNTGYSLE